MSSRQILQVGELKLEHYHDTHDRDDDHYFYIIGGPDFKTSVKLTTEQALQLCQLLRPDQLRYYVDGSLDVKGYPKFMLWGAGSNYHETAVAAHEEARKTIESRLVRHKHDYESKARELERQLSKHHTLASIVDDLGK